MNKAKSAVMQPKYRIRIVRNRKKYTRKGKNKAVYTNAI